MFTSEAIIFRQIERIEAKAYIETVHFDAVPELFPGIFVVYHMAVVHYSSAESLWNASGCQIFGHHFERREYSRQLLLSIQC